MIRNALVSKACRSPAVRATAIALALAVVAGCGTAPLSYVNDRQVYYKAVLNRYPVFVSSVDGQSSTFHPMPITTGEHFLTLDAQPVGGFSQPLQKVYPITIAPCTRYYLAAQRRSPLLQDWDLVVEETWPVAGCDPATEVEKARREVAAGRQPPMTSLLETQLVTSPAVVATQAAPRR